MPRKWIADAASVDSIAGNLMGALPLFPKRLLRMDIIMREQQMPLSHIQILVLLQNNDLSIGEISELLGIAKPNITPLVDSLRDSGFVERIRDDNDRRVVNVHLLEAGHEKLESIKGSIAAQVASWSERFNAAEVKELSNAMANMVRIIAEEDQRRK